MALTEEEKQLDAQIEKLSAENAALGDEIQKIKDKRKILTVQIDALVTQREQARVRAGRPTTQIG